MKQKKEYYRQNGDDVEVMAVKKKVFVKSSFHFQTEDNYSFGWKWNCL